MVAEAHGRDASSVLNGGNNRVKADRLRVDPPTRWYRLALADGMAQPHGLTDSRHLSTSSSR